jgi:GGDEF domain-containing protein
MLARLGGDEFICLMEAVRSEDEVAMLAREILGATSSSRSARATMNCS